MKVSFSGFDHSISFAFGEVGVVQISNQALFARVCQSLLSGKGEEAVEPYSLWNERDEEVHPSRAFIAIANPFDLPWKHRSLMGAFPLRLESLVLDDEDARAELQRLSAELQGAIARIAFQFNADYRFALEWGLQNHLKAFGLGVDAPESSTLLENLICFVDVAADMEISEALLFLNLKTFLTKNEQQELFQHLVFRRIKALFLENHDAVIYSEFEKKTVIDREFIEYVVSGWSVNPSLSQESFCSNGFGAVTN